MLNDIAVFAQNIFIWYLLTLLNHSLIQEFIAHSFIDSKNLLGIAMNLYLLSSPRICDSTRSIFFRF